MQFAGIDFSAFIEKAKGNFRAIPAIVLYVLTIIAWIGCICFWASGFGSQSSSYIVSGVVFLSLTQIFAFLCELPVLNYVSYGLFIVIFPSVVSFTDAANTFNNSTALAAGILIGLTVPPMMAVHRELIASVPSIKDKLLRKESIAAAVTIVITMIGWLVIIFHPNSSVLSSILCHIAILMVIFFIEMFIPINGFQNVAIVLTSISTFYLVPALDSDDSQVIAGFTLVWLGDIAMLTLLLHKSIAGSEPEVEYESI